MNRTNSTLAVVPGQYAPRLVAIPVPFASYLVNVLYISCLVLLSHLAVQHSAAAGDGLIPDTRVFTLAFDHQPAHGTPVPVRIRAEYYDTGTAISIAAVQVGYGEAVLRGSGDWSGANGNQVIRLQLHSPALVLPLPRARAGENGLFSRRPLVLPELDSTRVLFELQADTVSLGKLLLEDVVISGSYHSAGLSLDSISARLAGGRLQASLRVDHLEQPHVYRLQVDATDVELGLLPHAHDEPWISGGKTRAVLDLTGQGDTAAAVMASLGGSVLLRTGAGALPATNVDLLGYDLVFDTINLLNPDRGENSTPFTCALIHARLADGIVTFDEGIGLKTEKIHLYASGGMDLGKEKLDIGFKPVSQGRFASTVTRVVKMARLHGDIQDPEFDVIREDLLKKGAAAVTTGGLTFLTAGGALLVKGGASLLASKLYKDKRRKTDPCQVAPDLDGSP